MKIMWITNLPLADANEYLFHTVQPKEGWLVQLAMRLSSIPGVDLSVVSRTNGLRYETDFVLNNIHYYCFPERYIHIGTRLNEYCKNIYASIAPDVVHIHGTECMHNDMFVETCPTDKVVVSIQGLVSVISRYYLGGINIADLNRCATLGCRILGRTSRKYQQHMLEIGDKERLIIKNVKYVIGRTEWDRIHVTAINPEIKYFIGNETMRPAFYNNLWDEKQCRPHSLFVTQGIVPYKGFHMMLYALAIVTKRFPDTKLRVALLPRIVKPDSLREWLFEGDYPHYLRNLTEELNLVNNIEVLGALSEDEMVNAMLASNIYVSPSAIENSPNSLCEAQLLGMPTIASYVGGTPTIADDGKATEMYRYEEVEMLADKIIKIFDSGPDRERIRYARELALKRHDAARNVNDLLKIYRSIINS